MSRKHNTHTNMCVSTRRQLTFFFLSFRLSALLDCKKRKTKTKHESQLYTLILLLHIFTIHLFSNYLTHIRNTLSTITRSKPFKYSFLSFTSPSPFHSILLSMTLLTRRSQPPPHRRNLHSFIGHSQYYYKSNPPLVQTYLTHHVNSHRAFHITSLMPVRRVTTSQFLICARNITTTLHFSHVREACCVITCVRPAVKRYTTPKHHSPPLLFPCTVPHLMQSSHTISVCSMKTSLHFEY